jgi:hypothetical protein
MALHPNSELVAMAWIGSIPGQFGVFNPGMVSTQPPAEQQWPLNLDGISNFITVTAVGGTPMVGMPIAQPLIEVKAYATKPGSNKPPWYAANNLLQQIWLASMSKLPGVFGRALTIDFGGKAYAPACVIHAEVHTEARRIYSDARNWAAYSMDMAFSWREVGLVVQ